jgi:hypothetical protein
MSMFKVAAVAIALSGGTLALAPTDAQAQGYYGHGYGHHQGYNQGYYRQAPVYVPPRVARKQAQLSHRFVQKYGYVQPQHHYGYGRQYHDGYGYHQPQVQTYQFGW